MKISARPRDVAIDESRTQYLYWWLLVAVFFEYARPGAFMPGIEQLRLNSIVPLALLAVTLFAPGLRPFGKIFRDQYARWLIVFVMLTILAIPFASVTHYSFDIFTGVLGYFFLFIIIARVITSARRLRGILLMLILSHIFLIVMTPEVVMNPAVRSYIRGGTFLGDGNDFSLSLCIVAPMAIELTLVAKSKRYRAAAFGMLLLVLLAIVATQSRGATVALVVVLGFLWLFSRRKVLGVIGIVSVGLLVAWYASDAYFERMQTISSYQSEGSATARIMAWKSAARMAIDNPLMGVGTGHFGVAFGTRYMPENLGPLPWMNAHSMYFQALGELGVPGAVVVCVLVFGNIRAVMLARRRVLATRSDPPPRDVATKTRLLLLLAGSMLGFAVAGAFVSVLYYPHIFVLTGILLCARSIGGDRLSQIHECNPVAGSAGVMTRRASGVRRRQ